MGFGLLYICTLGLVSVSGQTSILSAQPTPTGSSFSMPVQFSMAAPSVTSVKVPASPNTLTSVSDATLGSATSESEWKVTMKESGRAASSSSIYKPHRRNEGQSNRYQRPLSYKTLPDEVFQAQPSSYYQNLEYEVNHHPVTKYPQGIETYSHNYKQKFSQQPYFHPRPQIPPQTHVPHYPNQPAQFAPNPNQPQAQALHSPNSAQHSKYIDYPPFPSKNHNHPGQFVQNYPPNQPPPFHHGQSTEQHPNYQEYPPHLSQPPTQHSQFQYNSVPPQQSHPYTGNEYPGPQYQNAQYSSQPDPSYFQSEYPQSSPQHSQQGEYLEYPQTYQGEISSYPSPDKYQHHHHPHSSPSRYPSHNYPPPPSIPSPAYPFPELDPDVAAELKELDQLDKEYHLKKSGKSIFRLIVPLLMLGISIPALGYMYTYMNRREFRENNDNARLQDEDVNYYLNILKRGIECYESLTC